LKVAALNFDRLVILDPVDTGWATMGADYQTCGTARVGWGDQGTPTNTAPRMHPNGFRVGGDGFGI